jgi:hypothetical protein
MQVHVLYADTPDKQAAQMSHLRIGDVLIDIIQSCDDKPSTGEEMVVSCAVCVLRHAVIPFIRAMATTTAYRKSRVFYSWYLRL